jgi:hypothetical protein
MRLAFAGPRRSLFALAGLLCLAAAPAPNPPPTIDQEATVVQELVVTAPVSGPAWWRVSTPTSSVYVMGVPEGLPKGLKWDTGPLGRRLIGANEFISTPEAAVSLFDILPLWGAAQRLKSRGPMEDGLSPDLRARFEAARRLLGKDQHAYSGWTPFVAALQMVGDYRKASGIDPFEPAKTIKRLARSHDVPVKPSTLLRVMPIVKAAESQVGDAGPACLDDSLHEIEVGPTSLRAAAEAWAKGDVAAALQAERGYEKCLSRFPEGDRLVSQSMGDATEAIAAALAKPGHSVAIVNLRTLLAKGGVLQQLQARGYRVDNPAQ